MIKRKGVIMVINWEAVNAIGSILGSLATFAAVVVALWQTSLKSKKNIKIFIFSKCHWYW